MLLVLGSSWFVSLHLAGTPGRPRGANQASTLKIVLITPKSAPWIRISMLPWRRINVGHSCNYWENGLIFYPATLVQTRGHGPRLRVSSRRFQRRGICSLVIHCLSGIALDSTQLGWEQLQAPSHQLCTTVLSPYIKLRGGICIHGKAKPQARNPAAAWWDGGVMGKTWIGMDWVVYLFWIALEQINICQWEERGGGRVQFPLMAREGERTHLANWHAG